MCRFVTSLALRGSTHMNTTGVRHLRTFAAYVVGRHQQGLGASSRHRRRRRRASSPRLHQKQPQQRCRSTSSHRARRRHHHHRHHCQPSKLLPTLTSPQPCAMSWIFASVYVFFAFSCCVHTSHDATHRLALHGYSVCDPPARQAHHLTPTFHLVLQGQRQQHGD